MNLSKQKEHIAFLYIALWALGRLQGVMFESSILSLLFYIPFIILTIFYTYKVIVNSSKTRTIKILSIFFSILLAYGLVLLLFNNVIGQDRTAFLIAILGSLGPIFVFYYFASYGVFTHKRLYWIFFLFLIISIIEYYSYQAKALLLLANGFDEITNNSAYVFLGLVPFLFLFNHRPTIQYISLAIISFYVILGLKRGAILILALMLVWFLLTIFKSKSYRKKFVLIILTGILLVIGIHFIERYYSESLYFQYRVESTIDGNTSGRDVIYATLWHHYLSNANLIELIFGEGMYQTMNITGGLKAHNDWLELLIDCGLMGVFLYLCYWIAFYRDWRRSKSNNMIYSILGMCLLFTFMRTLFSMSFSDIPFCTSLMMGYGFASLQSQSQQFKS